MTRLPGSANDSDGSDCAKEDYDRQSDEMAWGFRGPSANYAEWVAEGRDAGPPTVADLYEAVGGVGVTHRCGRTPFEVPTWDRVTLDPQISRPDLGDCQP